MEHQFLHPIIAPLFLQPKCVLTPMSFLRILDIYDYHAVFILASRLTLATLVEICLLLQVRLWTRCLPERASRQMSSPASRRPTTGARRATPSRRRIRKSWRRITWRKTLAFATRTSSRSWSSPSSQPSFSSWYRCHQTLIRRCWYRWQMS